jgi:hypothetical protein
MIQEPGYLSDQSEHEVEGAGEGLKSGLDGLRQRRREGMPRFDSGT